MKVSEDEARQETINWLEKSVLGLGLCPFAFKPWRDGTVAIEVCLAASPVEVLVAIEQALDKLYLTPASELETTLVVTPNSFEDFYDYNQFFDTLDALLKQKQLQGFVQIASFHPDYQFAGTELDDKSNLTNRSTFPIFHLIREQSIEDVLESYSEPESIPERNIQTVEALEEEQVRAIFPFLFRR